ncbi:hypothetical protein N7492_005883 [Penicillium capsulatum]|uniref:Thioesterase domain-containing protein n=1 Tax=Penicillium capsulatum TaxID=69766 RepID=A0A9W9LSD1_9EURO|nr:hypothetical protein N7492_005883 [Penicillium capsulatum]KAJ6135015.1 hypothetical protein N7512_000175 [Penicillium capsulatum]
MATLHHQTKKLLRFSTMAKVTFQPAGSIAFLHQQGPARSAVLHEQTIAQPQTQVSTVEFIPGTKPQPVTGTPVSQALYEQSTLDTLVSQIPLVQTLRASPNIYTESRPYHAICQTLRQHHYVGGSLFGPGKLALSPYTWTSSRKATADPANQTRASSLISVFHIGRDLCGHPGYVHGGLLSGLLDEAFASCVSAAFPSGSGMTANLNVDFRKPALPDRLYVLRAKVEKVEGRKAWVEGRLTYLPLAVPMGLDSPSLVPDAASLQEDGEGAVMVSEAKALFVEPKFANTMVPFYRS